ncbi:hypothetical protein HYW46_07285 [Candidatus Daviesbacteria bacterium]|nr:hypothetical protein [Candidatus Daviesbacteria bacterium]
MKRLVLVDGNAILHRAYHALPPMTSPKGELVNAVYGFTSMLLKAITDLQPDFMAVAWDEKGPTFRHQAYTQYKATREPTDEGLSNQYKRVYEVTEALNIPEFRLPGYEADDLIGTLARQASKFEIRNSKFEIIILTGDRDIMQVIDQNIKVLMPKKTLQDVGLYGVDEFIARFGFLPKQIIDYKALAGDASDNVPGVAGIGEVTATKLVKQFNSVEKIYKDLFGASPKDIMARASRTLPSAKAEGDPKKTFGISERTLMLLAEGAESAGASKALVTLDLNAPIKLDLEKCRMGDYSFDKVVSLFEELGFKSLVKRLDGNVIASEAKQSDNQKEIALSSDGHRSPRNDGQNQQTTELDLAVQKVLDQMSKNGVLVDLKFLGKLGKELKARLTKLEQEIYSNVGHQFNINSPKQLSEILFDELNLPVVRKTKTGRSTDEATLHELSVAHPVINLLLEYRQLFKLISTYIDALPKYVGDDLPAGRQVGRIHSTFNVEGAATGRLSSQNPNLQNIPIKGQLGGEIRKAFIAPKGKVLLGADYSQIELRIMAHLADDPGLKKAFEQSLDIHTATAAKIFKVPVEDVTKAQRMVGKTMNFATLYGQGPHALSRQLGVDFETARTYIAEYFEQFPKIKEWMNKTLEFGYENGYVETIWGRKRYIPELQASNRMLKSAGERAAINHPIQGTSADMIKKAMVEIDKEFQISNFKFQICAMILQVHDELLFECDPKAVEEVAKMVKKKMENALKLSVPVVVDLKVGSNWGEMEKIS